MQTTRSRHPSGQTSIGSPFAHVDQTTTFLCPFVFEFTSQSNPPVQEMIYSIAGFDGIPRSIQASGSVYRSNHRRRFMVNKTMGPGEYLYLALLSILWGASFFFIKLALRDITPLTIVLIRVGISALVLTALVYASGKRMPSSPGIWGTFFVMGALNNLIPFSLIIWGEQYVESSIASILNATSPVFSIILAHFLTSEEKMTPGRVAGVVLGLAGVSILIGFDGLQASGARLLGQAAMLGAALCYAFSAVYGRRFRKLPPLVIASGVLTGATVMMIPLVLLFEKPFTLHPGGISIAALSGLTLLSTALAFVLYFKILALTGPTNLLLVTFLIPVSAVFLGVVVLGENLGWNAIAGMIFIFAGLAVTDGRLFRLR